MEKKFTENKIQLQKGDHIYVFTDGFTDQFGGPKKKKFMKKRFYETLVSLSGMKMKEQKEELQNIFESWRGQLEQIDDVLVIGIGV